jgi:hypothetical protein
MANLGAIIDFYLHPDIPYFDDEHLIVGGVTGLLTAVLFAATMRYFRRLEKALQNNIKTLRGMLPICGSCKKIRDDRGYWNQLETYVSEHSEAVFTTGLCSDCEKKMYEDLEKLKRGNS